MILLPIFNPPLPGITTLVLDERHLRTSPLLRTCDDFSMLVSGQPSQPEEAVGLLRDLPPGSRREDKRVYGFKKGDALIGVLDAVSGYPRESVCFIGLFLLLPQERGQGLGRAILEAFARSAGEAGFEELMLGVVEENQDGLRFWESCGFSLLETRPAQTFGQKSQRVFRLRKFLLI
jgi:GNAT superfamily N-acetyltransferase